MVAVLGNGYLSLGSNNIQVYLYIGFKMIVKTKTSTGHENNHAVKTGKKFKYFANMQA